MWWALDLDDWSGSHCGLGTYPLIRGVKKLLGEIEEGGGSKTTTAPPKPTTNPATTKPVSGKGCSDPSADFAHAQFEGLKGNKSRVSYFISITRSCMY